MAMRVDPDKCIGCGICCTLCSEVFQLDGITGKAEVISKKDCSQDIVAACPTEAISKE